MEFEQQENRISKKENGEEVAYLKFERVDDNKIDATRTFVDESLRGQGVAEKLVQDLVEVANEENKKIIPTCPYIEKLFDRKSDVYGAVDARQ